MRAAAFDRLYRLARTEDHPLRRLLLSVDEEVRTAQVAEAFTVARMEIDGSGRQSGRGDVP